MIDKIRADNVTVDMRRRFGGENIIALSNEQQINDNLIEIPICYAGTVSDISLNGSVTSLDGIDITNALFVLVKNQTDKTENGIYIVNSSGWVRWDGLAVNMIVCVVNGDTQENTIWQNVNTDLDIGITEIEFKLLEFGGGSLPDGTVNNSLLAWNGSAWVEFVKASLASLGSPWNTTTFRMFAPSGYNVNTYETGIANGHIGSAKEGNAKYVAMSWSEGISQVTASQGNSAGITSMESRPSYSDTNRVFFSLYNSIFKYIVYQSGKIMSDFLTPNTVLLANANKEIVSLSPGTSGQVLRQKTASVVWENLSLPENRASFLVTQDLFPNLFVTTAPSPLPPPATSFRLIGDITDSGLTDFKVSLTSGKRYDLKVRLYLDVNDVSGFDSLFEVKINAPITWSGYINFVARSEFDVQYRPDITNYDSASIVSNPINLNEVKAFAFQNDTGATVRNLPYVEFEGIIITDTTDILTLSFRNSVLNMADGDNTMVIKPNSFIKAIECVAN